MTDVKINTEFIKLSQFLKFANVISSGGEGKNFIIEGLVKVNGEVCTMRGKKLHEGDTVEFEGESFKVVKE